MTLTDRPDGLVELAILFDPVTVFYTLCALLAFVAGVMFWHEGMKS